jgi:hypothetical protein
MTLQEHPPWVLDVILDLNQKLHRFPTVQQAVVIGQSQVHHRTNHNLPVDDNCLLLNGVQAEYGRLGKVDDRRTHERAEDSAVADGESTTGHVFDGKFAITSLK